MTMDILSRGPPESSLLLLLLLYHTAALLSSVVIELEKISHRVCFVP